MLEYCFGGGAAREIGLVLILLAAPPPIFLAGLPHTAFTALIPPATQANRNGAGSFDNLPKVLFKIYFP